MLEDISTSDDEIENDFEERMLSPDTLPSQMRQVKSMSLKDVPYDPFEAMRERTSSVATIRLHRRTRLAEKLKEVYDLEDVKEVWAGMSWNTHFVRSLMVYFRNALLAFAHCP